VIFPPEDFGIGLPICTTFIKKFCKEKTGKASHLEQRIHMLIVLVVELIPNKIEYVILNKLLLEVQTA
jgi:hypothetical protein